MSATFDRRTIAAVLFVAAAFFVGVAMPPAAPNPEPPDPVPEVPAEPLALSPFVPTGDGDSAEAILRAAISPSCIEAGNNLPMGCRVMSAARACAQLKCQVGIDGQNSEAARAWRYASCDQLPVECGGGDTGGGGDSDPPPDDPEPEPCRWYDLICRVSRLF